jgi:sugar transferase (PEP-CTERM/EpsH1 system associated)
MERPLVAHVLYSLDIGGLENGLVNIINRMPTDQFRHAIIAYTKITDFSKRITNSETQFFSLNHSGGQTLKLLPRLYRLFNELKPAIVHTRNLTTLDAQIAAACCKGAIRRVHGEHGWDVGDLGGENLTHLRIRKALKYFTHQQIALSTHTENYLLNKVGVEAKRVIKICNGVDTEKFQPNLPLPQGWLGKIDSNAFVIGTVGRASGVKNQQLLIRAFANLISVWDGKENLLKTSRPYLVIVGDGPDLASLRQLADELAVSTSIWFAGARNDVPEFMANFDVFVLPSLSEGISNSILEAMACGATVVASNVGGNPELVDQEIGFLFESNDLPALTNLLVSSAEKPIENQLFAKASRDRALNRFSLDTMVNSYSAAYTQLLNL